MLDFLLNIDISLFYLINGTISNPVLDKVMPFITNLNNWIIAYLILILGLIIYGGKQGRIAAILIILGIAINDQVCSNLFKDLIDRLRPCLTLSDVHLLVNCGPGKSMPSSHAANNFNLAVILSYFFPRFRASFFTIASLVALSRVYVGVHYPSDIIVGAILGYLIAYLLIKIFQRTLKIRIFNSR